MERPTYQLTERDLAKAETKNRQRLSELEAIEENRADKAYWKRRRTTYGLAKRRACLLLNAGDPEYYRGRGQGMIDKMLNLSYTDERLTPAYNQGYYDGFHYSPGEMRDYIAQNPNFQNLNATDGGTR